MSFDFLKNKKVHFIGIGGISMSALAEILLKNGYSVSGSDEKMSPLVEKLSKLGAEIFIGHNEKNVSGAGLIVYTAAISDDNPELVKGKELNIPLMDRAEFLGLMMKGHKYNVAVAGTHGKTTTTSMISHIAISADLDPTILVGGELDLINGNVRASNSEYFITEACEYKASFLKFFPYIGIILNIDADHLDFYKDIDDIENTFNKFASLIPSEGYLVVNADDERARNIAQKVSCNVVTYGIDNGDLRAVNIIFEPNGCASFDVFLKGVKLGSITMNVPGIHNVLNALAGVGTALSLNISFEALKEGLFNFHGTHRRFEVKGTKAGITVIDDYAHHPTEIKATLAAAQNYPHKRIFCVFQPHTYSRTKSLLDDFSESFSMLDGLILADIYAAREKNDPTISSDILGDKIREKGINCTNLHSFDEIVDYLQGQLKEGDLLLTMGAGDVYRTGEIFLNK
jgi:UDP-N-acetylmuramate--alanine ligase